MKISIITAVYNAKETIGDCLRSIINQSHNDIEMIVIDGGSTDGTLDVIKQYESEKLTCISEPDNGIYDAMNKGLKRATGDVIGFLNADDFYAHNNVLKNVAETLEKEDADSCYGELLYVHKDNLEKVIRYWKSRPYKKGLLEKGWFPAHPTFFVKRKIYETYGYFNTNFQFSSDVELMVRFLGKHEISTVFIKNIFIKMRYGGKSNQSAINIARSVWECYKAMKVNSMNISILYIAKTLLFRFRQLNTTFKD